MYEKKSVACPVWRRLLATLVSITLVGSVIPARSFAQTGAVSKADTEKAERIVVEAKADFKAGRFDAAAEKYSAAYALCKKPSVLFNAARAKQEAGKYTDARMLFVAYKTLPGVKADGSKEADEHIAECDRELEKIESAKVPRPPIVVEPIKEDVVPLSVEATKSIEDVPAVPTGFTFESKRLVSWQSGAALVLLGSGIGLMAHGAGRMTDANNMVVATQADKAAYHDSFSSAHTEWVVGIATCALGAGATYWALTKAVTFGGSATKPAAVVRIVPSFGGFTLAGVF